MAFISSSASRPIARSRGGQHVRRGRSFRGFIPFLNQRPAMPGGTCITREKRFSFRCLTPHLLRLVCTVQRGTENPSYTYYSLNRLIFMPKLAAAPVRRVHYTYARFGRASDLPHGPAPCACKKLSGVGKPLALWDDSSMSGATLWGALAERSR